MLREKIKTKLKTAMQEGDKTGVSTVRLIMAALKDRDIAARAKGNPDGVPEDEILSMLQTMIKQRHDSIDMYTKGGRQELADREADEITVIESFLPKQLNEEETADAIEAVIKEIEAAGIKDMGKVMAELKTKYVGQMDFGKASGLVKEKLASLG